METIIFTCILRLRLALVGGPSHDERTRCGDKNTVAALP